MEKTKKGIVREFSAGGVVFRKNKQQLDVLLIKPKGTDRWQLAKGGLEKGETTKDAALREVLEETGVKTEILDKISTIQYFYNRDGKRIFKTVTFFLMKYNSGKPEVGDHNKIEVEDVRWFKEDEALRILSFKDERKIVEKGIKRIDKGFQETLL